LLGEAAQVRLPPIGEHEAEVLLDHPTIAKLLAGFRGSPPADRPALAALIRAFAGFIERAGDRVAAIDVNPAIALPKGVKIVDATIEFLRPGADTR